MSAPAPRIAVIGCGRWGRAIVRDLVALGAAVIAVDPAASARQDALELGSVAASTAWDGRAVDGVVIATPTATHAAALAPFLDAATPVFVEKPLCADPAQARRILAQARCPLRVMEKWRYHPAVTRLAGIARSGRLGALIGLRTRRVQEEHRHADVDAIWTLAPHDLAIAREILGSLPPLAQSWREGDGPSAGVSALFAHEASASPWFALDVSAMRPRTEREIVLVGATGIAWFDDRTPDRIHLRLDDGESIEALADEQPLLAELRVFVAWLAGGPAPKGTLAEAVETVEVIAALHDARPACGDRSPSWRA